MPNGSHVTQTSPRLKLMYLQQKPPSRLRKQMKKGWQHLLGISRYLPPTMVLLFFETPTQATLYKQQQAIKPLGSWALINPPPKDLPFLQSPEPISFAFLSMFRKGMPILLTLEPMPKFGFRHLTICESMPRSPAPPGLSMFEAVPFVLK